MSNQVLVLDTTYKPLTPCSPGTARRLLASGKAAVYRQYPFTIILKKVVQKDMDTCQLKLDPGSKTTGLALLKGSKLIWAAELTHRGQQIKTRLDNRRFIRRGRRYRKTRYRQPRFLNRTRVKGWLAPSLEHRVLTTITWVNKLIKLCSINSIAMELVRFDTQKMQNSEISGTEYQQGTLYQYEVREYLLEKFNRTCAYCGAKDTPLEVEHIKPRSKGGSNRVSNLTLACVPCNLAKSNLDIKEFLADKPSILKRVLAQVKAPLKDAAAVNSTRWKLFNSLKETGLSVTTGTGGQTKFNRTQQGLAKSHWLDAACVGNTPKLEVLTNQPLLIKCSGHNRRQVIQIDKFGFPRMNKANRIVRKSPLVKSIKGFQTGDIVQVKLTKGKRIGNYFGRVSVRSNGKFDIKTSTGLLNSVNYKYCRVIHCKDGFEYNF